MTPEIYILASFTLLLVIAFINDAVAEYLPNNAFNRKQLPDIIHDNIDIWPKNMNIPNYLVISIMIYSICRLFIIKPEYVGDLFVLYCIVAILRVPAFTVTTTPPPGEKGEYKTCHYRNIKHITDASFYKSLYTCMDNLFSGHTCATVIPIIMLLYLVKNNTEKILLSVYGLFTILTIITARYHYTSDVYIALVISVFLVMIYLYKKKIIKA